MLIQPVESGHSVSKSTFIANVDKLNSYAIKAHGVLFFFKLKPTKELISMELVSDTEEYGSEYFDCEYNISFSNVTKTLAGNMNPQKMDSLGTYDHPFDWTKYIFIPATHFRKYELPEKINVELSIVKSSYFNPFL